MVESCWKGSSPTNTLLLCEDAWHFAMLLFLEERDDWPFRWSPTMRIRNPSALSFRSMYVRRWRPWDAESLRPCLGCCQRHFWIRTICTRTLRSNRIWPVAKGAVLCSDSGEVLSWFGLQLDEKVIRQFMQEDQKVIIGELETLAEALDGGTCFVESALLFGQWGFPVFAYKRLCLILANLNSLQFDFGRRRRQSHHPLVWPNGLPVECGRQSFQEQEPCTFALCEGGVSGHR